MDKEKKTGDSAVSQGTAHDVPEDLLGRDEYASCLMQLLRTYETYYSAEEKKRGTDHEGFVIGISSDCGTGKTTFLDILNNCLNNDRYSCIKYNAWKCDYSDNALESFIFKILGEAPVKRALDGEQFDLTILRALNNLIPDSIGIGFETSFATGFGTSSVGVSAQYDTKKKKRKKARESLSLENNQAEPSAKLIIDAFASEFESREESIGTLRDLLKKAYFKSKDDNPDRPLVIIIDELDRCRPTFAVQTLELIKHIFCIKGVVFIIAFDLLQLSSTVKAFYGEYFDAVGYLNRFFDYMSYMPDGDKDKFISAMLDRYGLTMEKLGITENIIDNTDSIEEKNQKENIEDIWKGKVREICEMFSLSLRDIKLVLAAFERLNKTSLSEHKDINAKILYLYFLALQYREPEILMKALRGVRTSSDIVGEAALELKAQFMKNPIPFWYKVGGKKTEKIEKSYRSVLLSKLDIMNIRHDLHRKNDNYETLYEIYKSNRDIQDITYNALEEISHWKNTDIFNSISFVFYRTDVEFILGKRYKPMRPLEYIQTNIELYTADSVEKSADEPSEESAGTQADEPATESTDEQSSELSEEPDAEHAGELADEPSAETADAETAETVKESADEPSTDPVGSLFIRSFRNVVRKLQGKKNEKWRNGK